MTRNATCLLFTALLVLPAVAKTQARTQPQESEIERDARLARRGAGVRVGPWDVRGLRTTSGGTSSELPAFEAWHQRGIDRHVSLDNSLALWTRSETVTQSGGPLGGSSTQSVRTFVVPLLTSIQLHPFTGPEERVEPFLRGGAGIVLGIENREGGGGTLFSGEGLATQLGFALQGSAGFAWQFSRAFGMSATAGYRWTHFTQDLAGLREYKGLLIDAGLSYRFQYR